ncbi:hypothetical protein EXIGLDRAFT_827798 [Exidia glandulosa HHB12029]|uniref:Pentacotripeptide-repeat region of PRORP domain-containing protein n=1 Tax=Exidia glandulosa HHB12029 TaxID=1314781 RepID=A0A165QN54_EXIGL|nr:hypothetical protein EXIGLDRAFT_827798 [Exidia glandulosa HHB12029]
MHFLASRLPRDQVNYLIGALCNIQNVIRAVQHVHRQLNRVPAPSHVVSEHIDEQPQRPPVRVHNTRLEHWRDARPLFFERRGTHPLVFWPPGRGPGPPREFSTERTIVARNRGRQYPDTSQVRGEPLWKRRRKMLHEDDSDDPALADDSPDTSYLSNDLPLYVLWSRLKHTSPRDLETQFSSEQRHRLLARLYVVMKWEMERQPISARRLYVWGTRINLALSWIDKTQFLDLESGWWDSRPRLRHLAVLGILCAGTVPEGLQAARHYFFDSLRGYREPLTDKDQLTVLLDVLRICGSQQFVLSAFELVLDIWPCLEPHVRRYSGRGQLDSHTLYLTNEVRRALDSLVERLSATGSPMPWLRRMHRDQIDPSRFVNALTLVTLCYCNLQVSEKALEVLQYAESVGVELSIRTRLNVARALTRDDSFGTALALLNAIPNGKSNREVMREYLYLYGHQGELAMADQFIDEAQKRGETLERYHQLSHMRSAAISANVHRTLELFDAYMPKEKQPGELIPEYWTLKFYEMVIIANYEAGQPANADIVLARLLKKGYKPNIDIYNTMLKYLARIGDSAGAARIWQRIQKDGLKVTHITYLELVTLCSRRGDPDGAQAIVDRALRNDIRLTRQMVTSLMNAYAEAGQWRQVVSIFKSLVRGPSASLRHTIEVFNVALKAYIRLGAPYKIVRRFFEKMTRTEGVRPNQITYALLTQSAAENRQYVQARQLYEQMHDLAKMPTARDYRRMPMGVMLVSLLPGRARELYREMREQGIELEPDTYAAILRASARRWNPDQPPLRMLNTILKQTPIARLRGPERATALRKIYAPVLRLLSRQGNLELLQELHEDMLHRGGTPSISTLWVVMDGHRAAGNLEQVEKIWKQIFKLALGMRDVSPFVDQPVQAKTGSNLLCAPLSTYIHALSAAGKHDKIAHVWAEVHKHGFLYDANNWTVLCTALVEAGQLDRAYEIIERILIPAKEQASAALRLEDGAEDQEPANRVQTAVAPYDARKRLAAARSMQSLLSKPENKHILKRMHFDRDPISPLKTLGEISPLWNAWYPHESLLRLLYLKTREWRKSQKEAAKVDPHSISSRMSVDRWRKAFPNSLRLVYTEGKQAYDRKMAEQHELERPRWRDYRAWLIKCWRARRTGYDMKDDPETPRMREFIRRELSEAKRRRRVPWVAYREWLLRWNRSQSDLHKLRLSLWLSRGRPMQDPFVVGASKGRGPAPRQPSWMRANRMSGEEKPKSRAKSRAKRQKRFPAPWEFERRRPLQPRPVSQTVFWA